MGEEAKISEDHPEEKTPDDLGITEALLAEKPSTLLGPNSGSEFIPRYSMHFFPSEYKLLSAIKRFFCMTGISDLICIA